MDNTDTIYFDISGLNEAISNFSNLVAETLPPLIERFLIATTSFYEAVWSDYRAAGMPYGETDEGCLRWTREVGEVRRLQQRAELILSHHEALANFRARLTARQPE